MEELRQGVNRDLADIANRVEAIYGDMGVVAGREVIQVARDAAEALLNRFSREMYLFWMMVHRSFLCNIFSSSVLGPLYLLYINLGRQPSFDSRPVIMMALGSCIAVSRLQHRQTALLLRAWRHLLVNVRAVTVKPDAVV